MRRLAFVLCAAGVAGCASATPARTRTPAGSPGGRPIADAHAATVVGRAVRLQVRSVSFALLITLPRGTATTPTALSATGSLEKSPRFAAALSTVTAGPPIAARVVGGTAYIDDMRLATRDGGRPWLRFPLGTSTAAFHAEIAGLLADVDPTDVLALFRARNILVPAGSATVAGQRTSVFTGHLTAATLGSSGLAPGVIAALASKFTQLGAAVEDLTVYLSDLGIPVRLTSSVATRVGLVTTVLDIRGLNAPVAIARPPARQTITLAAARKFGL